MLFTEAVPVPEVPVTVAFEESLPVCTGETVSEVEPVPDLIELEVDCCDVVCCPTEPELAT